MFMSGGKYIHSFTVCKYSTGTCTSLECFHFMPLYISIPPPLQDYECRTHSGVILLRCLLRGATEIFDHFLYCTINIHYSVERFSFSFSAFSKKSLCGG